MTAVVIVAFDGLQMWQVTRSEMPTLSAFADDGIRFERHHPVYPSVTRLNAASLVTGCYPATHGIAGNRMVFRDYRPASITNVLEPELRKVDAAIGGRLLLVPTLAELLAGHDMDYAAVVSGTSGNAYCHAPNAARSGGATIHPEFCLPDELYPMLEMRHGAWPEESVPNTARLTHATDIFLEYVIGERKSDVGLIWYSEPDKSQHAHGVASRVANDALRAADAEFEQLLGGLRDDTNVLVISDHGYSTVSANIDIDSELRAAGFPPLGEPGGVAGAPNGGTALFYVTESDITAADALAGWLMDQPWCGVVLASERVGAIEGALPASLAGIDGERGPDLAASTRWSPPADDTSSVLTPSFGDMPPPQGDHGCMSRTEMRNTLIARGPAFSSGVRSDVPSGNIDVAPTVLRLLGIDGAGGMDGRVLMEGLVDGGEAPEVETMTSRASRGAYRQYLTTSMVAGVRYVDEGNREEA
ncbi:MAG: alkaline phosphatase family protein [Chloroflexi bacterium]|nr:alkaline phosphatase family protein [Chloroflexota bacterium]